MSTPHSDPDFTADFESQKTRSATWFRKLRDQICAEFERLEQEAPEALYAGAPGTFEYENWQRKVENGGGSGRIIHVKTGVSCG